MPDEHKRYRVDAMTIAICIKRGDDSDVIYEEDFNPDPIEGFGEEDLFYLKKQINRDYYVQMSFRYYANLAIEADPHGPQGTRHTMDQIQNWYHRRYVPPFAPTCKVCGHVKALHGPSHSCKLFEPES